MLAPYEQSCIRREVGDELDTMLGLPVLPEEESRPWEVTAFQCLDAETASGIFLAGITSEMQGLPPEGLTCLQELVAGIDVVSIVAASSPEAGPAGAEALGAFTGGVMECVLGQMLTGPGGMSGISPPTSPAAGESLLWSYATGGWVGNSPVVNGDVVYAGSDDAHLYALDAETGELLWSFETGDAIKPSPTVTGGAVYVGSNDNHVYALDAATGELRWKYDTGGWAQFSPAVSGGFVFLGAHGEGASWSAPSMHLRGSRCGLPKCPLHPAPSSLRRSSGTKCTCRAIGVCSMPWRRPPASLPGASTPASRRIPRLWSGMG